MSAAHNLIVFQYIKADAPGGNKLRWNPDWQENVKPVKRAGSNRLGFKPELRNGSSP